MMQDSSINVLIFSKSDLSVVFIRWQKSALLPTLVVFWHQWNLSEEVYFYMANKQKNVQFR